MANCFKCKNVYIEDIWNEWCCRKGYRINTDDDGCISDKYFECKDFCGGELIFMKSRL